MRLARQRQRTIQPLHQQVVDEGFNDGGDRRIRLAVAVIELRAQLIDERVCKLGVVRLHRIGLCRMFKNAWPKKRPKIASP